MRERTTWNRTEIQKQASAMSKQAEDPRAMNQDHLQRQPSADKYLTGDPSTFAEDVHPSGQNWKAEYSDGETARDEIGLPEMRGDTFNHPETDPGSSPARGGGGRQASLDEETLVKKADLCCKVARQMLGPKAIEAAVEDQALALMNLSDPDLIATVNRLAQDQDQDDKQDQGEKQAQDQQQAQEEGEKQAKELPPEFLENIQKKKDEAKDKDDKEASAKLGTLEQMAQQVQQMAQQLQQMMQAQQQVQQAPVEQGQGQQMQQQAIDAGQPQAQTMAEHQQQALDAMLQEQSNDQMIDQMLAQGQQQQVQGLDANDFGIQMDSPSMDIGEVGMGPEDEVLSTLFANNAEVQNAQQAHVLQHGAPAPMQVQAAATPQTRTASTRTIGTRPTNGVTQLGGSPSPSAGGDVEKLSNLWNSAPDVSDVFRS
jgi:hypothetical protein